MMLRAVWPALVRAPLLVALAGATGAVPDDVAVWFSRDAATTITTVAEGLDAGSRRADVTVGEPLEVHLWSEEFRAGVETDAPVVPLEQWLAPYRTAGRPAGTVVAWRDDDGSVTFASVDGHAELAAALEDVPSDALLVHEPMLGAHFALAAGTVTTLVPGFYEGAPASSADTFQAALTEQVDGLLGATAPAPEQRWWGPVTWGVLTAAVAAALGGVVLSARRRAGHT